MRSLRAHVVEHAGSVFLIHERSAHRALVRLCHEHLDLIEQSEPVFIRWVSSGPGGHCDGLAKYRLESGAWALKHSRGDL